MFPVRLTVPLTGGAVTLHAWPATTSDAHLHDLLIATQALGEARESWDELTREDIEQAVWAPYWRLVHASLRGQPLPERISWADRVALLDAMWQLNDVEVTQGKLTALTQRAAARAQRILTSQGLPTPPSTSM